MPRLKAERVEILNTPISKGDAAVLSKDMPGGISVVGMNLLKGFKVTFDLKRMRFLIKDP